MSFLGVGSRGQLILAPVVESAVGWIKQQRNSIDDIFRLDNIKFAMFRVLSGGSFFKPLLSFFGAFGFRRGVCCSWFKEEWLEPAQFASRAFF